MPAAGHGLVAASRVNWPFGPRTGWLGDIDDLGAFVHKIVWDMGLREPVTPRAEIEDLVAVGIELALRRHRDLAPGESLEKALGSWLELRLRDEWRETHREWRRNTRGGTSYSLGIPTGLAWEHSATSTAGMPANTDERASSESRMNLHMFRFETDFYNTRLVGRYMCVPSAAAIATQAAGEIFATLSEERALTTIDAVASTTTTATAAAPPKN